MACCAARLEGQMTRSELRSRALTLLNDAPDEPIFWSPDELHHLITEAQETLAEEVEALTRSLFVPVRAGWQFYPLAGIGRQIMTPWRLWTRNRQHRLWPISMRELEGHYERWLTVTGEPEWWFLVSWDLIGLWPTPTTGGGLLEVDCFVWPDALQDDQDEPEFPDPDHDVLVDLVTMEGQIKEWDVARALEIGVPLLQRAKDSQARSGLRLVQERFFGREGV
jgi:hypothetical protein